MFCHVLLCLYFISLVLFVYAVNDSYCYHCIIRNALFSHFVTSIIRVIIYIKQLLVNIFILQYYSLFFLISSHKFHYYNIIGNHQIHY